MSNGYSGDLISTLEKLEGIRKRPTMYIGDIGVQGAHKLFEEVLNNSVDEVRAGRVTDIFVEYFSPLEIAVSDNGNGIPTETKPGKSFSVIESVFMELHTSAKFDSRAYMGAATSGLNGVGLKAVNALSIKCLVENNYRGVKSTLEMSQGKITKPFTEIGPTKDKGVKVRFHLDTTIFHASAQISPDYIQDRLDELAYLCKATFHFIDYTKGGEETTFEPTELKNFYFDSVDKENQVGEPFYWEGKDASVIVGTVKKQANEISFVNVLNTYEHGSHLSAVKDVIVSALRQFIGENDIKYPWVQPNLWVLVSINDPEPEFRGQHKTGYGCQAEKMRRILDGLDMAFRGYLPKNKNTVLNFLTTVVKANLKATSDIAEVLKLKGEIDKGLMKKKTSITAGKLLEVKSCSPDKRELFVVEGDSAKGSAVQARDASFQEVFPLRGKIQNAARYDELSLLGNKEIQGLIYALGTAYGNKYSERNLRTKRVILAVDPDPDGAHIMCLLISFFLKYYPQFVKSGFLYVVELPLFMATFKDKKSFGNSLNECLSDYKARYGIMPKKSEVFFTRAKGLGEFNPSELKLLLMDPATRNLKRLEVTSQCENYVARIMSGHGTTELLDRT